MLKNTLKFYFKINYFYLAFLKSSCIMQIQFNRRELVLQAERKVKPSTDNFI